MAGVTGEERIYGKACVVKPESLEYHPTARLDWSSRAPLDCPGGVLIIPGYQTTDDGSTYPMTVVIALENMDAVRELAWVILEKTARDT